MLNEQITVRAVAPIIGVRDFHHDCNARGIAVEGGLDIIAMTGERRQIDAVVKTHNLHTLDGRD